ncbi:MAG: hypothetical protein WEB02_03030 [Methylophaga sp.]
MQLSEQQLWTLDNLGIPVWQIRQNPLPAPIDQPNTEADSALVADSTPVIFNCQAPLLIYCTAIENPAEQQLLTNILKAIGGLGLPFEQCDKDALLSLSADQPMPQQILIFGEEPADLNTHWQNRAMLLPSLGELINQPKRKAGVWTAICQLQQTLS